MSDDRFFKDSVDESHSLFMFSEGNEAQSGSREQRNTDELSDGAMEVDRWDRSGRDAESFHGGDEAEFDDSDVVLRHERMKRPMQGEGSGRSDSTSASEASHESDLGGQMSERSAHGTSNYLNLAGNYWGNTPPVHDTFGTIQGANARAWAQAAEDLVMVGPAPKLPASGHARPINIFQAIPLPVRKCYSSLHETFKKKEQVGWVISVALREEDLPPPGKVTAWTQSIRKQKQDREIFDLELIEGQDRQDVERVEESLRALCEKVPLRLGNYGAGQRHFMVITALSYAAQKPGTVPTQKVVLAERENRLTVESHVHVLDAEALGHGRYEHTTKARLHISVHLCVDVHTIPEVPDKFAWLAFPEPFTDEKYGVSERLQIKACKVMRYLSSMIHGRVLTKKAVTLYCYVLLERIGYGSSRLKPGYQGMLINAFTSEA
ncbi:hypothetical protein LTR17_002296 [Elasticomyces elasticus]|nr:hypothetical protein LTR17_002296 [Elasticomyces elasticus]